MQARQGAIFTTCTAAVLLASLQSALAADVTLPMLRKAPAPVVAPSWTGFYVGGEFGFDGAAAKHVKPGTDLPDTSIGSVNRGLVGGAYGGFNYQALPWLLLGVEGAWSSSRVGYREFGADQDSLESSKFVGSVAGRLGVVVMPTTMVYAKAGQAWMDVRGFNNFTDTFSQTIKGVMVGAGVESMVTPNFLVRLEGTYTHATDTLSLNFDQDEFHPDILQVMVGGAYKFDIPGLTPSAPAAAGGLWTKAPPLFTKAPPASAAVNWTGLELGGFVSINVDQMDYFGSDVGEDNEQGPFDKFSVGGGGFVGFNVQFSRVVLGAEASANLQKADFNVQNGVGFPLVSHFASIDNVYAASLRLGWLLTPETLLYAKGGPAWIRVTPDTNYWIDIAPNTATGAVTVNAYQYGGGVETYLNRYFSVRVEGMYTMSNLSLGQLMFQAVPSPSQLKPSLLSGTLGAAVHF